jgi:hypothetical protein
MPCFIKPETLVTEIRSRLNPNMGAGRDSFLGLTGQQANHDIYELADRIIKASINSFYTDKYDQY